MKIVLFAVCFFISVLSANGQNEVDQLIKEGIALHDKADYEGAIKKYDEVLALETANYKAMYEKSLSLVNMKQYDAAEVLVRNILKDTKDPEYRRLSYVNYGTLLDYKGEPKKAVNMYEKGIKEFPDSYLLHFNKGITLVGMKEEKEAIESFKMSVKCNPNHASSHNALGRLISSGNRIPAIMAMVCFLIIEPKGSRAEDNVKFLNRLLMRGITRNNDSNVTITLDPSLFDKKKKKQDDDFSSAEMILSLLASSNEIPDSLGAKTEADRLSYRLQTLTNMLEEDKKGKGFFKEFYVPFFQSIKKNELFTIVANIALASSKDSAITEWIKENKDDIDGFYRWWENYEWPKP